MHLTVLIEFHVEGVPKFRFSYMSKSSSMLLLIHLGVPRECIGGKISTVEDFRGIPGLKTRILLF